MLAQGHSLQTIEALTTPERYHLYKLYAGREAGPMADARLLHAIYQTMQVVIRVAGNKDAKFMEYNDVAPSLCALVGQKAQPSDPLGNLFTKLKTQAQAVNANNRNSKSSRSAQP